MCPNWEMQLLPEIIICVQEDIAAAREAIRTESFRLILWEKIFRPDQSGIRSMLDLTIGGLMWKPLIGTNSVVVDTIDVLAEIPNTAPSVTLTDGTPATTREYAYGLLFQEVITFNQYLKASLGLRYSQVSGISDNTISSTGGDVWDPLFGVIITPFKDFNLFASYTTTTSLRGAANLLLEDRQTPVGPAREKQFEAGFKSEWFDNRLRFNATWFLIRNNNLTYEALDENGNGTGYYIKAGNLTREGIELDLTGRLLENMDVVFGYSYLDAAYRDSPYYHEGSSPMNATRHTANGWLNYSVLSGGLRNLSFGVGVYYVGERPLAEYTYTVVPGSCKLPV